MIHFGFYLQIGVDADAYDFDADPDSDLDPTFQFDADPLGSGSAKHWSRLLIIEVLFSHVNAVDFLKSTSASIGGNT